MEEITIRSTRAQRNLMEWSRRVADCRSSGLSVARWCSEHSVNPKTYYNWQKKVFAVMIAQKQTKVYNEAGVHQMRLTTKIYRQGALLNERIAARPQLVCFGSARR